MHTKHTLTNTSAQWKREKDATQKDQSMSRNKRELKIQLTISWIQLLIWPNRDGMNNFFPTSNAQPTEEWRENGMEKNSNARSVHCEWATHTHTQKPAYQMQYGKDETK